MVALRRSPAVAGRLPRRAAVVVAVAACICVVSTVRNLLFVSGTHLRSSQFSTSGARASIAMAAAVVDNFDPWTALEISPNAGKKEARKAYKKMISKYHPDVNPGEEAAAKLASVVRANAVITGDDKGLDQATLLKNAVDNLRNDIEFRKQRVEQLKADAAREEEKLDAMEGQIKFAEKKRDEVTSELGIFGGVAIGLVLGYLTGVALPIAAVVGAVAGIALKDSEDAVGKTIRGTGEVAKGFVGAVGKGLEKADVIKKDDKGKPTL